MQVSSQTSCPKGHDKHRSSFIESTEGEISSISDPEPKGDEIASTSPTRFRTVTDSENKGGEPDPETQIEGIAPRSAPEPVYSKLLINPSG